MTSRKVIELICDVCGRGEGADVETRRVGVDGVTVEAEVCATDWAGLMESFVVFARHGRKVPTKTKVTGAVPFPGTSWKFSAHALKRLGERKIDPTEIVRVIDNPGLTRPGNATDLEIRESRTLKAVVAPERGIIITVARHDESDGEMVKA